MNASASSSSPPSRHGVAFVVHAQNNVVYHIDDAADARR